MIIEEQMDKVVTKLNEHPTAENNVYSLDDGSTLLERVAPDAITTTTVAKERFIVRPIKGDLQSLWMDVTHTADDLDNVPTVENSSNNTDTEKESIVLDMAGYKTRQTDKDEAESNHEHVQENTSASWGWGKSHANKDDSNKSSLPKENFDDTVQLKSGQTYRIEMSLCGFSAFGYDEDENTLLFNDSQISYDAFVHNPSILNDPRLVFRYNNHYYSAVRTSPLFTSLLVFKKPLESKDSTAAAHVSDSRDTYSYGRGWRQWQSRSSSDEAVPIEQKLIAEDKDHKRTTFTTTTKTTSVGWSDRGNNDNNTMSFFKKRYAKTLRLTSDQLKKLNLRKGVNTISFSVSSSYQGTATCVAKVFYWDYDIEVVISDIDGTITKSDTMGHLMTMIGKDWTHEGVAQLYTDIANNGYHFIYLTSRAIGQADYTRDYLKKILQNNYQLPDGPVIMSPDRLFTSLHREVIMRKPEMFKMACLKDIQRLFGGRDPFYAGFGNRITDAISYRSVNVPSSRIFTIDAQGDVKLELVTGFKSSYIHLNDLVDQIFPPIDKSIREEFSDYNFWKMPMPDIDIPELEQEVPTSPKPKPIKPDPTSLPKESVVTSTPEPKRGIFRSFTRSSRSNSTATIKSPPTRVSSPPPTSPKQLTSVNSAPNLLVDRDNDVDSIHLSSPRSLPEDYEFTDDTSIRSQTVTTTTVRSTGIISKLFSRRRKPEANSIAEEDFNDDDLVDLDLDKIPFI